MDHKILLGSIDKLEDRLDFTWNNPKTSLIQNYLSSKNAVFLETILLDGKIEYGVNASGREQGKIPFINVEHLNLDGQIRTKKIRYVDKVEKEKLLKENDVLISRSRTVGVCSMVTKKEQDYTFGSYVLRFRIKQLDKIDAKYVVSHINSILGQSQMLYLQTGAREVKLGGGNNINPNNLKKLLIIIPETVSIHKNITSEINVMLQNSAEINTKIEIQAKISKTILSDHLECV